MLGKTRSVKKNKNINNMKKEDDQKMMRLTKILITINIPGSTGPLRFLVNKEDLVSEVIDTALKLYARQQRLPVLGTDIHNFLLYCLNVEHDAVSPLEAIGSYETRSFMLWKIQRYQSELHELQSEKVPQKHRQPRKSKWKAWFNTKCNILLAF